MSDDKNKDKIFKLIWIQSINVSTPQNFYKALFRDIDKGFYLQQKIFPEELAVCTLGTYYKNDTLLTELPPDGETFEIDIETKKDNLIKKIEQVISNDEYNLTHYYEGKNMTIDYTQDNKRQFCVVIENEKQKVIFPCHVIGTTFYFTSTSMREHIFAQNLNALLYKAAIDKKTRKAMIWLKPGAANNDAAGILRFYGSEVARKKWYSIKNSLRKTSSEVKTFSPIIIDFPVEQALHMTVRGLSFPDQQSGKEKILVFDILKENSSFDFDDIEIIRDESERVQPEGAKKTRTVRAYKTSNTLKIKVPTSKLSHADIKAYVGERNTNIPNMKVTRKYTRKGKNSDIVRVEEGWEAVDISLLPPETSGDKGTRPGEEVQEPEEREPKEAKDAFTLEDFKSMVQYLKNERDVHDFILNGPSSIPLRDAENPDYLYSFREVCDKETNERRQYMSVNFTYKGHHVCVIEIDQTNLPAGCASYGLVVKGGRDFNNDVTAFLKDFVWYKRVFAIRKAVEGKKIQFLSKHHPIGKTEKYYKGWCEELLWRIEHLENSNL